MSKKENIVLEGGVIYDEADKLPNYPSNQKGNYEFIKRANVLYQYPYEEELSSFIGLGIPEDYASAGDYSYNSSRPILRDLRKEHETIARQTKANRVYIPERQNNTRVDYINKTIGTKGLTYIPKQNEEINKEINKLQKTEKNYEEIANLFYPNMPEKSQIQENKRIPLLGEDSKDSVNLYDDYISLADKKYVVKPLEGNFTGGAAKLEKLDYNEAKNKKYIEQLKNYAQIESDKKFLHNLGLILDFEKGFSDRKTDKRTNLGVIQDIYNVYRKEKGLPFNDVKNISIKEAVQIYYTYFWKKSGAEKLEHPMDFVYFDMYINTNPVSAKRILKRSNDSYDLIKNRRKYYDDVIKKHPEKEEYRKGWNNRLDKIKNYVDNYNNKEN